MNLVVSVPPSLLIYFSLLVNHSPIPSFHLLPLAFILLSPSLLSILSFSPLNFLLLPLSPLSYTSPLSSLLLPSLLYPFSLCFLSPFSSFPLSSSSPLPFFFSLSSLILLLPLPCSSSSLVPFFLSLSLPPRRSSTRETKRADRVMQNLCKQQR